MFEWWMALKIVNVCEIVKIVNIMKDCKNNEV